MYTSIMKNKIILPIYSFFILIVLCSSCSSVHLMKAGNHIKGNTTHLSDKERVSLEKRYGDTPLHIAAFLGDDKATKALIKHGVDLDIKNKQGHTALLWAVDKKGTVT